jgi:hypothetical protein
MGIKSDVDKALEAFEEANPSLKGKVRITDMERTWEEQLVYCLERPKAYPESTRNFIKAFPETKDDWPDEPRQLTPEQRSWWKNNILKQAGKSPGFAHVGGSAVDLRVRDLNNEGKQLLKKELDDVGVKILMEKVNGSNSQYNVSISQANVFHCTK